MVIADTPHKNLMSSRRQLPIEVVAELNALDERSQRILIARFGLDDDPKSLKFLATEFGISKSRILQIQQAALLKLRSALPDDIWIEWMLGGS